MRGEPVLPAKGELFRRFLRQEDGNIIVLGLVFFTLMVMMGGMAVDLMRFEARRTQLQQTTDRAVLAAASMRQTLDPTAVVNDYFTKAGLFDKLKSVTVTETLNSKEVAVTASSEVDPFFMQMTGVNSLTAPGNGTATEKISDVEISLVLDISGSMGSYSKIDNLKTAAKEFVDTVLSSSEDGKASISIIPYNMQVDGGSALQKALGYYAYQTNSYCLDWKDSDYSTTSLTKTDAAALQQTAFSDFSTSSSSTTTKAPSTSTTSQSYYSCPKSMQTIMPFSKDATALKAKINSFAAGGNTSIDVGMKWGVLLLDPASQWILNDSTNGLIKQGVVNSVFSGRPLNPNDAEVLKVVVLMTDGENTTQYGLNSPFAGTYSAVNNSKVVDKSRIWRDSSTGNLALYYPEANNAGGSYYAYTTTTTTTTTTNPKNGKTTTTTTTSTTGAWTKSLTGTWTNLTWPEVWTYTVPDYVEKYLYAPATGQSSSTWLKNIEAQIDKTTSNITNGLSKDQRLHNICAAAKAKNIVVFGIGFADAAGTTVSGKTQIQDCATSNAYYYDVAGLQIQTAFRSIASQISTLRLTQ